MADILCSDPNHASRSAEPDWAAVLGTSSIANVKGMICPACARLRPRPRRARRLQDLEDALASLSAADKTALRNAVTAYVNASDNPTLRMLKVMAATATLSTADKNSILLYAVAMILQETPTFATALGINVIGDEEV
jgi:hypothetical protein